MFVDMVRAEAAQRQQQQDDAERKAAAEQAALLRPPTRPADLPIYGQDFLSRA
jgi:hypothetical protein